MHILDYSSHCAEQSNGQLMGSLSSFNNLSLINSALFALARSYNHDDYSSWHYVNGDDILFTATPAGLARWKEITKSCGLVPSFGKNFYSEKYFTINTQFFYERKAIPLINYRLLKPLGDDKREHKIGSNNHQRVVAPTALGAAWRDLCARAQIDLQDRSNIRRAFLRAHRPDLLRIGKDLLLPSCWGGCGAMDIKSSIGKLPININIIRDIAHKSGGHISDQLTEIGLQIGKQLDERAVDRMPRRITERAQFIFSGLRGVDTLKTCKPCRHCLSLRPIISKLLTPALVGFIRASHLHQA
jgi:hypothetical protein